MIPLLIGVVVVFIVAQVFIAAAFERTWRGESTEEERVADALATARREREAGR